MTSQATFYKNSDIRKITATSDMTSGQVVQLAEGRVGIVQGLNSGALVTGESVALATQGVFDINAASATTFSAGDEVFWDSSASAAVPASVSLDASADFYLGVATAAKTSGQTTVKVDLNAGWKRLRPFVYEFDCETGVDTATHTLIPAAMNPTGLKILSITGEVSEVFAGSSQDQGIVTIKDTATTPNTICTLTPSDAAADAVGDVIQAAGAANAILSATGVACVNVAAGRGVTGVVSQATSGGTPAGKMKVYVLAIPLV
ncbi:TPA: hypothetical protein DDW35_01080 [Candidatus Sumerlaeota bacterium]|jgi:predicted RecA/RadA family phage recombinase|nr:hypothetical protein [Candidatus Sumerlaeota bacterium]